MRAVGDDLCEGRLTWDFEALTKKAVAGGAREGLPVQADQPAESIRGLIMRL